MKRERPSRPVHERGANVRALACGTLLAGLVSAAASGSRAAPAAPAARDVARESTTVTPLTMAAVATGVSEADTLARAAAHAVPVFLGGRELFRVVVGREGLDPAQRAAAIRGRLDAAVADANLPVDSVRFVTSSLGTEVRLGHRLLWVLTPADLPSGGPAEVATWLGSLTHELESGIERERARRSPVQRLLSLAVVAGITLAAWLLLWLMAQAGRAWRRWLDVAIRSRLPSASLRGVQHLIQRQVGSVLLTLLGRLDVPLFVAIGYGWLAAVFSRFSLTQSWSWQLSRFAFDRGRELMTGAFGALPGLLTVAFVFLVFHWLARASDRLFAGLEDGSFALPGFHTELARPTRRLVKIGLWIAAVIVAYPYLPGAQSKAVQGVSVLIGLMVSLGSSGVIGNMIAGLVVTYSRSFRLGDRVRIGEHVGDVIHLGTFATKLRSLRNEEITLPNGQLLAGAIVNYTRNAAEGGLWLHTQVTIGYDAPWRQVHALLIEAALRVPGVEPEPRPIVYQRALNDYHVGYEITALTRESHAQLRLYSDLHAEIQDAFARAGVEILSPVYAALRDANAPVLPSEPAGPRDDPGGFRVRG